jgi:hypothetical protein
VCGVLKQQVQLRLAPENALGMISIYHWTGGYIMPVCGRSWVTASCEQQVGGVCAHTATSTSDLADLALLNINMDEGEK